MDRSVEILGLGNLCVLIIRVGGTELTSDMLFFGRYLHMIRSFHHGHV